MHKFIIALILACGIAGAQVPAGYKAVCIPTNTSLTTLILSGVTPASIGAVATTDADSVISSLKNRISADESLLDMHTFYMSMVSSLGGGSTWGQFWDGFANTNYIAGGANYSWSQGLVTIGSVTMTGCSWLAMCSDSNASTVVTEAVRGSNLTAGANTSTMSAPGQYGSNALNVATYGATSTYCPITTSDFSVSLWVKQNATNQNDNPWVSFGRAAVDGQMSVGPHPTNGASALTVLHYADDYIYPISITTQVWHHIVVTEAYASKAEKVYVDGVYRGGRTISASISPLPGTSVLSGYVQATANHATAHLQQVAVWNHVLSQGEVNTLYNSGSGQSSPTNAVGISGAITSTVSSVVNFQPTSIRIGALVSDPTGIVAPNTDFPVYGSRDAGTNWTQMTMVDQGNIAGSSGTNRYFLSPSTAIAGVGSNLVLKGTSANGKQVGLKAWILNAQP